MPALPVEVIDVSLMDFSDTRFNISKSEVPDTLVRSISTHGLLEYPVILRSEGKYIIVSGHNRLSIERKIGVSEIPCRIMDRFDMNTYLGNAILKMDRGEVGPIGRLRLFRLIRKHGSGIVLNDRDFARRELGLPDFLIDNDELIDTLLSMPDNISAYADSRDVNYRVLREIASMPREAAGLISSWLCQIQMRVNIFRDVVEMLSEIFRRDNSIEAASAIAIPEIGDPRSRENWLHSSLMAVRYPRYSAMKKEADYLTAKLRGKGIDVTFPAYFEGDSIGLTVRISKQDGPAAVSEKLGGADAVTIGKLLDLL